jgi:DNA-binding MarR family transcriptional regulator
MSTEKTAEQFIELVQRYIRLRPKLILPEHVIQFKKKMAALRASGPEDHSFVFRVLMLLSQSAEPLTMGELSSELDVPMSTATRIVDGLVKGGMAERVQDPSDRRVVRVGMSQTGRELYETGLAYSRQRMTSLLKDFTADEQKQFLKLLNKFFEALLNEK